jgi:hypothetical protein
MSIKLSIYQCVLAFAVLLSCSSARSQGFGSMLTVDGGESVRSRSPEVQWSNGKVYLSYFAGVCNIRFTRSTDGGKSFDAPTLVAEGISTNEYTMQLQRAPRFAVSPKGRIHMTWTEDRFMDQTDVWYATSSNDGKDWSLPRSLAGFDDSVTHTQDYASVAVDSSGIVHVSFLDDRESARGVSKYMQLYYTRCTNGGEAWSEPVRISYFDGHDGGTCDCCKQEIAAGPNGEVYVAFRSNIEHDRSIFVVRSLDQGITWSKGIRVQDEIWRVMMCPTQGPDISVDRNGDLHLTWRDARNETVKKDRIFYDMLSREATDAGTDFEVTDGIEYKGTWPSISLTYEAGITIPHVFYESLSMNGNIKHRRLSDGAFSEPEAASQVPVSAELVSSTASPDGIIYLAWQETGESVADGGDIVVVSAAPTNAVQSGSLSDTFVIGSDLLIPASHETTVTVQDVLGRTLSTYKLQPHEGRLRLRTPHQSGSSFIRLDDGRTFKLYIR